MRPRVSFNTLISTALFLGTVYSASAASVTTSFNNLANGNNAAASVNIVSFGMVVSQIASTCLPEASAQVAIQSAGTSEDMLISVSGLPPNTAFDFFIIQVPNAPFGLA